MQRIGRESWLPKPGQKRTRATRADSDHGKNYAPRDLSGRGGGKRLALSLPIDWTALLLGLFAAFVVEFLRYASPNFGPPKSPYKIVEIAGKAVSTGKINWAALLTSALYVAIGGATTVNGRRSSVQPISLTDEYFSAFAKWLYPAVDAQRTVRGRN